MNCTAIALAAGLLLVACTTPQTDAQKADAIMSVAAACETIGNGLQGLADSGAVAKLDSKGRAVLDAARGVARPFCSDPKNPPSNLAAASSRLIQVSGQIVGLAAAVGK